MDGQGPTQLSSPLTPTGWSALHDQTSAWIRAIGRSVGVSPPGRIAGAVALEGCRFAMGVEIREVASCTVTV